MAIFVTAAFSYLLGSIPFGYILVRVFRGQDVRRTGSGNIGATNVLRTSRALGVLTLLLDALKGSAAVVIAVRLTRNEISGWAHPWSTLSSAVAIWAAIAALFAILGHMFPVWLKFRGGKGVATGLGSFAMLAPRATLLMIAICVVVVLVFRYVSLGSMVAVALFPFLAWRLRDFADAPPVLAIMAVASLLIIAKHHQNIRRLFAGTEPRIRSRHA